MKIGKLFANREPSMTPIERITRERDELRDLNSEQAQMISQRDIKIVRLEAQVKQMTLVKR